ncbi:nucleoside triphosphate pyrophosphohydrolase [Halovivax cerinus]|uniref:Phosphoribosyl-ATP pyrophosphohydrolase n=1 Tax=Halovivax cerinus TaxID=1487865 RepID=A0ABD5NPP1_9EURY|nr:nucleoside triphosphate pyrophosphohydrolase [Halovivax cerinus]
MVRSYDKLVRDGIPELIVANGERPTTHVADGEEYSERLIEKLEEEVTEYRESREVDELADILEVVHAIRADRGVSVEALADRRSRKAERRGRFDEGIVLERVEADSS